MSNEQTLKMTELDYLTAAPHLQMIKAALPYINIQEQRIFPCLSKSVNWNAPFSCLEKKKKENWGFVRWKKMHRPPRWIC